MVKLAFFLGLLVSSILVPPASFSADMLGATKAYESGNFVEAFESWSFFARRGNREAQFNLANLYRRGQGVDKSLNKSAMWMLFSAQGGFPAAQYNFAVMLLRGDGVTRDTQRAEYWLRQAVAGGSQLAVQLLQELTSGTTSLGDPSEEISEPVVTNPSGSTPSPIVPAPETGLPAPVVLPPAPTVPVAPAPVVVPVPVVPAPAPAVTPPTPVATPPAAPAKKGPRYEARFGSHSSAESWKKVKGQMINAYGEFLQNRDFRVEKKAGESGTRYWIYVTGFESESEVFEFCNVVQGINRLQVCFLEVSK